VTTGTEFVLAGVSTNQESSTPSSVPPLSVAVMLVAFKAEAISTLAFFVTVFGFLKLYRTATRRFPRNTIRYSTLKPESLLDEVNVLPLTSMTPLGALYTFRPTLRRKALPRPGDKVVWL
jgi:hypothetical protein